MKKRTDELLMMHGGPQKGKNAYYHQNDMFYERQEHFGFPITTTHDGGVLAHIG